jgi:hypothetical protein
MGGFETPGSSTRPTVAVALNFSSWPMADSYFSFFRKPDPPRAAASTYSPLFLLSLSPFSLPGKVLSASFSFAVTFVITTIPSTTASTIVISSTILIIVITLRFKLREGAERFIGPPS